MRNFGFLHAENHISKKNIALCWYWVRPLLIPASTDIGAHP